MMSPPTTTSSGLLVCLVVCRVSFGAISFIQAFKSSVEPCVSHLRRYFVHSIAQDASVFHNALPARSDSAAEMCELGLAVA